MANIFDQFDQPAPQSGPRPITLGQPDPFRANKESRDARESERQDRELQLREQQRQDAARAAELAAILKQREIDNGPAGVDRLRFNAEQNQKRAKMQVARQGLAELRQLYEQDLKGKNPFAGRGFVEFNDSYPTFQRFRAKGQTLLPLIRPLVAGSAKEGDSNMEMMVFQSYIPTNDDTDETIVSKMDSLETLLNGMDQGYSPTQTIEEIRKGNSPLFAPGSTGPGGATPGTQGGPGSGPLPKTPGGADASTGYYIDPTKPGAQGSGSGSEIASGEWRRVGAENLRVYNSVLSKMIRQGNLTPPEMIEKLYQLGFPRTNQIDPGAVARAVDYARKNPGYKGSLADIGYRFEPRSADDKRQDGLSGPTTIAANAIDAATFNNLPTIRGAITGENPAFLREKMAVQAEDHPNAALGGQIIGSTIGIGGIEGGLAKAGMQSTGKMFAARPMIADSLYGTISGASMNPDDPLMGAVTGGASTLFGGRVGQGLVGGSGAALRGVRDAGTDYLGRAGIGLTPGQTVSQSGVLGRFLKGSEDRLEGLPFIGDMIKARRTEGLDDFNRAALNEAGAPIGAPPATQIAEPGVARLQGQVSDAYGDALNGVTLTRDPIFDRQIRMIDRAGLKIPNQAENYNYRAGRALNNFDATGKASGKRTQAAIQELRGARREYAGQPNGADLNAALAAIDKAILRMADRQAPHVRPKLNAANKAYGNLSVVEDAVLRARNTEGRYTPAQLGIAADANAKKYGGKKAAAGGNKPFFELQRHGQDILPGKVPDSGTDGRLALPGILAGGTAIGGGAGYAGGDPASGATKGLLLAALLSGAYTKTGQKALAAALGKRTIPLMQAGRALDKPLPRRAGGMLFAGPTYAIGQADW